MDVLLISREEWDHRLEEIPHLPFHSGSWLDTVSRGLGSELLLLACMEGGEPACLFPGLLFRKAFLRLCYGGIPYGGPLLAAPPVDGCMTAIATMLKRMGVGRIRFQPFSATGAGSLPRAVAMPLVATRLSRTELDGSGAEIPDALARGLRKAARLGVEEREMEGSEGADLMYRMYISSMMRNRAPGKYPLRYFLELSRITAKDYSVRFFFACIGTRPVAGLTMLESPAGHFYLHGGFDPSSGSNHAMDLLFERRLEDFRSSSAPLFDFGLSAPGDEGLRRFKRKWGGREELVHSVDIEVDWVACRLIDLGTRLAGMIPSLTSRILMR